MLMQAEYLAKLVATAKEEDSRKEIKARGLWDGGNKMTKSKKERRVLDKRDGDDGKRPKGLEVEKEDNNPQVKDATPPSPASNPPRKDRIDPFNPDAAPFTNSTIASQTSTTYVTIWKTVQPIPSSSSTPVVTSTVYVPIYVTATVAPSSSIEPTTSTSALAPPSQSTAVQVPTSVTSDSPTPTTTSISRTSFQRYTGTSRASLLTSLSTSTSSSETANTSPASDMAALPSSITTSAISSAQASSSQASASQASSPQVSTPQPSTTQSSTSQLSSSEAASSGKGSRTTFERFQASCTAASTSCTISSTISSSISGGASITGSAVADTASSTTTAAAAAASQSLDRGIGTTLVVFAGLGGAALIFFGVWACIKRRIHGINELKDPKDEKDIAAFSGAGRRKSDNENRLWGPASTGAGAETTRRSRGPLAMPVYVPPTMPRSPAYDLYQARQQEAQMGSEMRPDNDPYRSPGGQIQTQDVYYAGSPGLSSPQYSQNLQPVSPSMQIVGAHDPYRRPHPSPRAYGGGGAGYGGYGGYDGGDSGPVELPAEVVNPTSQYSEYTDIQPQSQWSVSRDSSTTISTVPRFRNIESWASDQRLRSGVEGSAVGQGGQGGQGGGLGGPLGDGVGGGRGVGDGPAGSGLRNVI